ncbi:MAG: prepilin-type N-terminal cleavage/methylation domain-containing protein [Planctomycetaceae bacterium]|nr:prepilin-type N-terminal cleavage/methylation domain-containing protein [Planctomycetaceae bacterium]
MRFGKAFTLIELLVVIAIIALLLAIITPALRLAKQKGASAVCMTNLKNMALGWYTYAEEHNSRIMSAEMEATDARGNLIAWIGMPRYQNGTVMGGTEFTRTTPEVSDEHEELGIEKGVLYPYLGTTEAYHCVGDTIRKGPDGTRMYVSYCVPLCLNSNNTSNNFYHTKRDRITAPGTRFCFVESGETLRGNWISGGHFVIACPEYGHSGYGLWSPIAINHGDSSAFGFTDGHAELRKWHDKDVFEHYNRTANSNVYNTFIPDQGTMSDDIRYIVDGWAYRYKK